MKPFLCDSKRVGSLVVLCIISCAPISAQSEAALRRDRCLLTERQLVQAHDQRDALVRKLRTCSENGPTVLLMRWQSNPTLKEIDALAETSGELRDRRLLTGLLTIAQDPSESDEIRLGALIALTQYILPYSHTTVRELLDPSGNPLAVVDHRRLTEGAEPLTKGDLAEARTLIESIAASDADPVVARAAEYLAAQIALFHAP